MRITLASLLSLNLNIVRVGSSYLQPNLPKSSTVETIFKQSDCYKKPSSLTLTRNIRLYGVVILSSTTSSFWA